MKKNSNYHIDSAIKDTIRLFYYWCGRLGLRQIIPFRLDRRVANHCGIEFLSEHDKQFYFNPVMIKKDYDEDLLKFAAFHEIGHILFTRKEDIAQTEDEIIYEEYTVEKFAMLMMKYFYYPSYKNVCAHYKKKIKTKHFQEKFPIHYKAFKNIKEYQ
jgi:hypothetical protein